MRTISSCAVWRLCNAAESFSPRQEQCGAGFLRTGARDRPQQCEGASPASPETYFTDVSLWMGTNPRPITRPKYLVWRSARSPSLQITDRPYEFKSIYLSISHRSERGGPRRQRRPRRQSKFNPISTLRERSRKYPWAVSTRPKSDVQQAIRLSPHDPFKTIWDTHLGDIEIGAGRPRSGNRRIPKVDRRRRSHLLELRQPRRFLCAAGQNGRGKAVRGGNPSRQSELHHQMVSRARPLRPSDPRSKACARRGCRRSERDPENCGDPGRRCRRVQPARGSGRGSHALAPSGLEERPDRPRHRRPSWTDRQAHRRRQPHRVPQRGRRGALRDRSAERPHRAQCRRAARAPHRVPLRHPSRRRRRGERRRFDG